MRLGLISSAAVFLASSLVAHASTTIDFNGLSGNNIDLFTAYTESGFTVTNTAGQYLVGQAYGNPGPSLFSGGGFGPPGTGEASITIIPTNGGTFSFQSADLANDVGLGEYEFLGQNSTGGIREQSGEIYTGISTAFFTYASTFPDVQLTSLVITESGGEFNVDNIVVTPGPSSVTPEPSTFLLLGTGLLGIAGLAVRRVF